MSEPDTRPPLVVALAMPHYGEVKFEAARAYFQPTGDGSRVTRILRLARAGSILTANFNRLWCSALNRRHDLGVTHFAMLHADIAAMPGWLDTLLNEMELYGADVMSAVVPIKTDHGLTSTAMGTPNPYLNRRLTMKEVHRLPATFYDRDVTNLFGGGQCSGWSGPLLVNTGCFVADLRKPWASEVDESGRLKWAFRFQNEIVRDPATGLYRDFTASEDWLLSHHLAGVGAKVYATRKVGVSHIGDQNFVNSRPWGEWERDETHEQVVAEMTARAGEK